MILTKELLQRRFFDERISDSQSYGYMYPIVTNTIDYSYFSGIVGIVLVSSADASFSDYGSYGHIVLNNPTILQSNKTYNFWQNGNNNSSMHLIIYGTSNNIPSYVSVKFKNNSSKSGSLLECNGMSIDNVNITPTITRAIILDYDLQDTQITISRNGVYLNIQIQAI